MASLLACTRFWLLTRLRCPSDELPAIASSALLWHRNISTVRAFTDKAAPDAVPPCGSAGRMPQLLAWPQETRNQLCCGLLPGQAGRPCNCLLRSVITNCPPFTLLRLPAFDHPPTCL
jgi:hypothetical protein